MAFGNIQIVSTRNGGTPITGWRQDLAIGDVVALALSETTGVSSYRWQIIGRPEGSTAGGSGPEPCVLGTGATAGFTVDGDSGPIPCDGTYIVGCVLNGGGPSETLITVGLTRVVAGLTYSGLPLRRLGGFESMEDTSGQYVRQGWATMLNRWLGYVATLTGGGGGSSGRWHTPFGTATEASGYLRMPDNKNCTKIALSTSNLRGIAIDDFQSGDIIAVTITNASIAALKTLLDMAPATPMGYLPLKLDTKYDPGTNTYQSEPIDLECSPARLLFQLDLEHGYWQLLGQPIF
jgi:hypothetical protein